MSRRERSPGESAATSNRTPRQARCTPQAQANELIGSKLSVSQFVRQFVRSGDTIDRELWRADILWVGPRRLRDEQGRRCRELSPWRYATRRGNGWSPVRPHPLHTRRCGTPAKPTSDRQLTYRLREHPVGGRVLPGVRVPRGGSPDVVRGDPWGAELSGEKTQCRCEPDGADAHVFDARRYRVDLGARRCDQKLA